MIDESYREWFRAGLAPLVEDVRDGPEWDELFDDGIVMATSPAPPKRPPGWLVGLAVAAVVFVVAGIAAFLAPSAPPEIPLGTVPSTTLAEDSTTTGSTAGPSSLPSITLGSDQVWPQTPSRLSPVDLAVLFAQETLGWDAARGTEFSDAVPNGPAWVRIGQPGVDELVDVLTVPSSDGGRIIVEVGPPWERGVTTAAGGGGGITVDLLRIASATQGEVTLRLADGQHVVGSTRIDLTSRDAIRVVFPDVDLETVRSALVRYVDSNGNVIAANGGLIEAETAPAQFEGPPILDQPTGIRVYFSTDNRLTEVDIDSASATVHDLPELAPGDPLYRMARRGEHFVFYGETATGPAIYALDPAAPTSPRLISEAGFFVPSAVEDRIWLAILDESSPATVRALQSVREVTVDGQVTVEDVAPPDGRWPIAAVDSGLVFQGDESLEVWDPSSQEIVEVVPGPFAVAARQNQILACGQCDQLVHIDLDTGIHRAVALPPGVQSVDGYGGSFSPDGSYVAVPGFLAESTGVVLVDIDSGTTSLVPGMTQALNGYPQVAWSPGGDWLFYSVGGLTAGTGRLFAYRPGDTTAYGVPVTLEGQYYSITTD